jgi:hypothetical protein
MCTTLPNITMELPRPVVQQLQKLYTAMAEQLWGNQLGAGQIHKATTLYTFKELRKGLFEAAGANFTNLNPNSPLFKRLSATELDSLLFSSIKNANLINEGALLRAASRNRAEFETLFKQSFTRSYLYQLDAELDHVKNVAFATKEWTENERFISEGFTWLQIHTQQDERVRADHSWYDNIKLPISHPFWKTYYPPNGYRCRCYVTQDFEGEEFAPTEQQLINNPPPKEFRKNFGETGRPFGGKHAHPYYAYANFKFNTPLNYQIVSLLNQLKGFKPTATPYGEILVHPLIEAHEIHQNIKQATRIVTTTKSIKLLPSIGGVVLGLKTPDVYINGEAAEFKSITTADIAKGIVRTISDAAKQMAQKVYIYLSAAQYNKAQIVRALRRIAGQPNYNKNIKTIVLQIEGVERDISINRTDLGSFTAAMLP